MCCQGTGVLLNHPPAKARAYAGMLTFPCPRQYCVAFEEFLKKRHTANMWKTLGNVVNHGDIHTYSVSHQPLVCAVATLKPASNQVQTRGLPSSRFVPFCRETNMKLPLTEFEHVRISWHAAKQPQQLDTNHAR